MIADDSAMKEIEELKNLKFLQNLTTLMQDQRNFSQDILLEEMLANENSEKFSDAINDLSNNIKNGVKDLTFAIKQQQMIGKAKKEDAIDAEFVRLSEDTITDLVKAQNDSIQKVDEVDYPEKVSDAIFELLEVNKQVRDLAIRENTLPATMTDLESASDVYYQKSMYYLQAIKAATEYQVSIMKNGLMAKGNSQDMVDESETGKKSKGGIFDSLMDFFGLGWMWGKAKKLIGKFDKILEKWIVKPLGKAFGWLIEKVMGMPIVQKIMASPLFGKVVGIMSKVFGFLKPVLGPLLKLGKAIGGKTLLFAAFAMFDFFDGIKNAANIVGKKKELLTIGDKINAGLASIISGISIGLIDSKTVYKAIKWFEDEVSGAFQSLMSIFPKSVNTALKDFWDLLFDKKKGVFGSIVRSIELIVNDISDGNYMKAFKDMALQIPRFLVDLITQGLTNLTSGLTKLMGPDKMAMIKDTMVTIVGKVTDMIMDLITSLISILPAGLGKSVKGGLDAATGFTKSAFNTATSWFNGDEEKNTKPQVKPAKIASAKDTTKTPVNAQVVTPTVVAQSTDAQKTAQLSQDRLNAPKIVQAPAAQPIINIQSPEAKPSVTRKTRAGTETIIHMNSALGRP